MKIRTLTAAIAVGVLGAGMATADVPLIGGNPIATLESNFGDGNGLWGVDVFSYVYDAASDVPTGFSLDEGELLFVYVLDASENTSVSVTNFNVGNVNDQLVTGVGFSSDVVPDGFDETDREDPFSFSYSGPALSSIFSFVGDPNDATSTLDPGEWALVYTIVEAEGFSLGPATAAGAGIGNTQQVLVADIPAPGALALLAIAGFGVTRRRRS